MTKLQRIRKLFDQTERLADLGHYEWDEITHRYSYCSDGMARLLGFTIDDYLQRMNAPNTIGLEVYLQFVHPDDRAAYLAACDEYVRSLIGFDIEYRMLKIEGDTIEVREVLALDLDVDGNLVRTFGFLQDITKSKQLERAIRQAHDELELRVANRTSALRDSEARYMEVLEELPIGIWEEDWSQVKEVIDKLDFDRTSDLAEYLEANPSLVKELFSLAESGFIVSQAIFRMYELPDQDALIRWRDEERMLEVNIVAFCKLLISLHAHRWIHQYEKSHVLPGGKPRDLSVNIVVPKRHRHNWARVIYAVDDITKLKQSEGLLNQAVRLAGIGYYVWDAIEERYLYFSDQHARTHGLSPIETTRRAPSNYHHRRRVHPDDRHIITEALQNPHRGNAVNIEYRTCLPDGSNRYIRETIESVFNKENLLVREIGLSQDITDHKLTERRLQQSQKLEAIGRLTGGVAHDFNNLLAVIMGNAELLLEEGSGNLSMLQSITHAAEQGAALTRQLLAFSLEQNLTPKGVNFNKLVENMLQMLMRTLGEAIRISTSLDKDLWPAYADSHQVENALLNLAINSRDAMPDGGELSIKTTNKIIRDVSSESRVIVDPGEYVVLSVTDSGHGMSGEVLEKAFEPFFTTKDVSKGSGLGLAMVFGFVKQSGGHVELLSEPDKGTEVRLYLPRATDLADKRTTDSNQVPVGNGESIFLIEDDPDVRHYIEHLLNNLGYRFISAADGHEALRKLRQMQQPDLLLSDVVLPGHVNGPEVASRILQTWPDLNVLFMTGHTDDTAAINKLAESGAEIIRKPFQRSDFASKIHSILQRSNK